MSTPTAEKTAANPPDGPIVAVHVAEDVPADVAASIRDLVDSLGEPIQQWSDDPDVGALVIRSTADFSRVVARGLEAPRPLFTKLPKRKRRVVLQSVATIVETLTETAFLEDIEVNDLAARARVASDTFRLIAKASPDRFEALSDAIAPIVELDPAETSDEDAEAAGRLLVRQLHERVARDSYAVRELAELGLSRQRLGQLRKADRLFAVELPYKRSLLYPRWQFDDAFRPRPEMPELIAAAKAAKLEPIAFHALMTNIEAGDGVSPVDMLKSGQRDVVLSIIAAADEQGA